jgi:hypothetical protein
VNAQSGSVRLDDWSPATPAEVAGLFANHRWWLAGGYALELAAGRSWREHGDIDVLLLRRDQLVVQQVLVGWEWWAAEPPGTLRPWQAREILPPHVHDIWCRPTADAPWRIQVMLDESSGEDWVSRRNPSVRRSIATIGHVSPAGVPYLAPEIQLFYKAKGRRPKDEQDFAEIGPELSDEQRAWLTAALTSTHGPHHPWRY